MPGLLPGARYKYELITSDDRRILKADPMAFATEIPPGTASVIAAPPAHDWADAEWMAARGRGPVGTARCRSTRSTSGLGAGSTTARRAGGR